MRFLFLLLLSFPASATVWSLENTGYAGGAWPLIGGFETKGDVIIRWNFLLNPSHPVIGPFGSNTDCFQVGPPGSCQRAQIIAPDHLFFHWQVSPSSLTELDL